MLANRPPRSGFMHVAGVQILIRGPEDTLAHACFPRYACLAAQSCCLASHALKVAGGRPREQRSSPRNMLVNLACVTSLAQTCRLLSFRQPRRTEQQRRDSKQAESGSIRGQSRALEPACYNWVHVSIVIEIAEYSQQMQPKSCPRNYRICRTVVPCPPAPYPAPSPPSLLNFS